jgi:hypothetical protein
MNAPSSGLTSWTALALFSPAAAGASRRRQIRSGGDR